MGDAGRGADGYGLPRSEHAPLTRAFTKLALASAAAAAAALSACATAPNPAQVCTAEWIEPRADAAVERIEDRLASALDAFSSASKSWAKGRSPGPIQMLRLSNAAKSLERELTDGRGIRDLRLIASTCNDPDLIRTEVMSLLDRQDVPDRIVAFLEGSGLLDRIIRTAEGLDRPARNG